MELWTRTWLLINLLSIVTCSAAAESVTLTPVTGTCSDLDTYVATAGVTDASGNPHPDFWAWTNYVLLLNGRSIKEHRERRYQDLLQALRALPLDHARQRFPPLSVDRPR
jgi:hypothetical protein